MEHETPHDTEVSCKEGFSNLSDRNNLFKDIESVAVLDEAFHKPDLETCSNLESNVNRDGMESRGYASPKSYTSQSSLEENFPTNISIAPITECIKTVLNGAGGAAESHANVTCLESDNTKSNVTCLESDNTKSNVEDDDSVCPVTSNIDQVDESQVGYKSTDWKRKLVTFEKFKYSKNMEE